MWEKALGRQDLRGVDNHSHSILAVRDLSAIKIDGVCVVHGDLENRFLYRY